MDRPVPNIIGSVNTGSSQKGEGGGERSSRLTCRDADLAAMASRDNALRLTLALRSLAAGRARGELRADPARDLIFGDDVNARRLPLLVTEGLGDSARGTNSMRR